MVGGFIHFPKKIYNKWRKSRRLNIWTFWKLALEETLAFLWQQLLDCSPGYARSCCCRRRSCSSSPSPSRWSSSRRSWTRDSCRGWPGCCAAEMETTSLSFASLLNHDLRKQKSVFIHLESDQLAVVGGNQVPSVLPNQLVSANKKKLFLSSCLLHLL